MSSALPPEHPDADLVADLAADVLPTHQARAVEAHVMACPRCTSLLTDAEQVRNLLLTDDPGPMPPDVRARIDQALQLEATTRQGLGDSPMPTPVHGLVPAVQPPTPQVRVISPWEDTTTIEAFEAARKRQAAAPRADRGAGNVAADRPASGATTSGTATTRPHPPRLTRPSRGPSRSRRDLRDEVRDVKAGRRGTVLAAAAGVVVLLGLSGYVVVGLFTDRQAGTDTVAASSVESADKGSLGGAGGGPPVLTSGTNYSETTLAAQARALVNQVSRVSGQQRSDLQAPARGGVATSATTAAPGPAASESSAMEAGNLALRDPATLTGCLAALRAGGRRPVAVDLARFDGRDAALIVLNGTNGGYEVWAVSRDCRPGADGTITYLDLTR
jgi:hypothetical protein